MDERFYHELKRNRDFVRSNNDQEVWDDAVEKWREEIWSYGMENGKADFLEAGIEMAETMLRHGRGVRTMLAVAFEVNEKGYKL